MCKLEAGTRIQELILVERIGAGSYGEVWKAVHTKEARVVAVKLATTDDAAAALARDGVPQRDLVHPSIVRVHAVDAAHRPPYVVLEHVEGRTLRQLLRERGRLEPQDVGSIFRQLVDALAYAHERGVVHGDVKPENILVIEQGIHNVVKLTDFQIGAPRAASPSAAGGGVRPSLRSAVVSGTYHYLAPEQEAGGAVDGRADLYALGVVLFEMATGTLPQGRDLPSDVNPALSWWWDHIFTRCYSGKERRYASADELRADLRAVYAGAPEWGALPSQRTLVPAVAAARAAPAPSGVAGRIDGGEAARPPRAIPEALLRTWTPLTVIGLCIAWMIAGWPKIVLHDPGDPKGMRRHARSVARQVCEPARAVGLARPALYALDPLRRPADEVEDPRAVFLREVEETQRLALEREEERLRELRRRREREAEARIEERARGRLEAERARALEEARRLEEEEASARAALAAESAAAAEEAALAAAEAAQRSAEVEALRRDFSSAYGRLRDMREGPAREAHARSIERLAQRARRVGYVLAFDEEGEPTLVPGRR
jgi:serine/threonine protein kinase